MITSQEINAMISMQQQQAGYMGGVPMAVPMAGASQYPPQFSYGPQPYGAARLGQAAAGGLLNSVGPGAGGLSGMAFGITQAAGMGAMGAGFLGLGTAATKTAAGTGLAGAFGAVESNAFLGGMSRLNPLNSMMMGGIAGVAEAGGLPALLTGAGIRAGVAGAFGTAGLLHPVSVGAMLAAAPLMAMHRGAQQYSQTSSMIGAYNQFANPFAASGRGFSETQMASMVSGMRALQSNDPFLSMRDMQQAMSRFNEMGMNQGERDAEQVMKKFTAMTKSIQAMSKMMGTTMDEATKVFGQMRGVGFYSGADVMQNTLLAGTMRGQGISGSTMLGAQAMGGGITRGAGLGTTPGAKAVGGVMAMLTGGRGAGALTNEEMMNITGAATPDQAIAQLSTTMAGSLTNFYTQTGVGQSMLAALGATNERGEFTGGLDAEAIEGLRTGRIDINNLVSKGRGKVSTRNAALSFKTRGQDVAGALLSEGDPTAAIGAIMQSVAGDKFKDMDPENLISLLTERIQGLGRKEAEAMTKLYREGEKIRRESQRQIRSEMQAEIFATDIRENRSLEGIKRRVLGGLSDAFSPLTQAGQDFAVGAGYRFQRVSDTLFGVTRMGASDEVHREMYRKMLLGETEGPAGGGGLVSGFSSAELTGKALRGTLAPEDISGPTTDAEKRVYELGQRLAQSGVIGKTMISEGITAQEAISRVSPNLGTSLKEGFGFEVSGGVSAGRVRELVAKAGAESGSADIVRAAAATASGSTSVKEIRAAQEAVLGGNALFGEGTMNYLTVTGLSAGIPGVLGAGTAAGILKATGLMYGGGQALDALMETEGMDVASRLSQAGVGNEEFLAAVYQAKQNGISLQKALPGVDLSGISGSQIEAYAKWAESYGQQGLSASGLKDLTKYQAQGQERMDMGNLAAMAAASSEAAAAAGGFFGPGVVGQQELVNLKQAAESQDVALVGQAGQDLLKALELGKVTQGDINPEKYGALADTLRTAMGHRKTIERGNPEEIAKMLSGFGMSPADIAKLDLGDKEALQKRVAAADFRQGAELSGGGAFSATTAAEAVKYYAQLAHEVRRIQERNDQLEARIDALRPGE